jgi:outer membrane protein OmpA-like peptidoglycan-associated protein
MRLILVLGAALVLACGRTETVQPTPAPPAVAESSTAPAPAALPGEDPEPPDAQARAEAVLLADFNKNKSTMLKSSITTIVDKTSAISGFATALAAREEKIEDKLGRLAAKVTETEITIQLPGAILFDFDSAQIRPDAERTLNDVKSVIASYAGRPVRVEGHTDSIASDDYNKKLSEQRAKSVTSWFAARGIEAARLSASGLGEAKPVASNDDAAGRQQNRRVEIVIAKK